MENNSLQENFTELQDAIQSYVKARINYWKLTVIEKVAKAGTFLFSTILVLLSVMFIFLLLSLAFSFWFEANHGTIVQGLLISAGMFALLAIVLYVLRKRLFVNNIVKNIAIIIYDDEEEKDK